ncbi:MAG: amidohydrolase [Caulobacteraceae bacterium]|nr:amidohydrolase [Caulobacteraceae bacterium]
MKPGLVSADDHVDLPYVPRDLWTSRLPARLRENAPTVVDEEGGRFWRWEGARRGPYGRKLGLLDTFQRAGLPTEPETDVFRPTSLKYRLADMDTDGVAAQVLFPPVNGMAIADVELKRAVICAFNDWFVTDFTGRSGGRLIAAPSLPQDSVEMALEEAQRLARLSAKGVLFDPWSGPHDPFDPYWAPLWSFLEEAGLVLHFHIGKGMHTLRIEPGSWRMAAGTSVVHMQFDELIPGLIFSGVAERHPKLQIVLAECGVGWVPYVLEMMDFQQQEWGALLPATKLPLKASDYFRRQMAVTFEYEQVGARLIPEVGADNVMWAADYPHGISTFPHSVAKTEAMLAGLDAATRAKVTSGNARRIYGIDA